MVVTQDRRVSDLVATRLLHLSQAMPSLFALLHLQYLDLHLSRYGITSLTARRSEGPTTWCFLKEAAGTEQVRRD